jgi:hypothetical protein
MTMMQDPGQAVSAAYAKLARTTFTIPEGARSPTDPKKITLRELTVEEEKAAMRAAQGNIQEYMLEGAMRSLDAIDGKAVTWEANEKQNAFGALSPKVRELVTRGFGVITLPKNTDSEAFLASAQTAIP